MRILQLNLERGWRGGERQTLLTIRALRTLGHQVELVARTDGDLARYARCDRIPVHHVDGALTLSAWLSKNGHAYDVIHAQTANCATSAVLTKQFHHRPIVFSKRTDFPVDAHPRMTRCKWNHIDQIIAISCAAAIEPIKLGMHPEVIRSAVPVIHPNPKRIAAFLDQHDLHDRILIGTTSALVHDKDPLTLIHAAVEVCAVNDQAVFVHWGASGSEAQPARECVARLGLEKRYLFLGFEENPEQLYPALSVFVMTSRFEALCSSVLDAMVQKIPVVATSGGGLKETLADNRGLLAPVGNANMVASHINWVLRHPEQAQAIASHAYRYVREQHDVESMARHYLEIYQQQLDRSNNAVRIARLAA